MSDVQMHDPVVGIAESGGFQAPVDISDAFRHQPIPSAKAFDDLAGVPAWSITYDEALRAVSTKDSVMAGADISEELAHEFFHEFPARINASLKQAKLKGEEHTIRGALNVLYRYYAGQITEFDYVDKELISAFDKLLKQVLTNSNSISFDRILTPKFSMDAVNSFKSLDLRAVLVHEVQESIVRDMKDAARAVEWETLQLPKRVATSKVAKA